ncbi:MAG: CoA ester lyase [Chloroflexi bacterium]|nr:CoA ester lyase [Chloroflexota bacterium]
MRLRSLLFVPAGRRRMVERALGLAEVPAGTLDVAMLDLEDGTAQSEKEAARALVAEVLTRPAAPGTPVRFVRVNAAATGLMGEDVRAAVRPGVAAVMLPKVETPEEVRSLEAAIKAREREAGLASGTVRVVAFVESARGLLAAPALASATPRMLGLMLGAEDYALDIGLPPRREAEALQLVYARSALVNAAAAARIAPLDGVWPQIPDIDGLRADSLLSRRLGFVGRSLIHPTHVDVVNEVYAPDEAEVAHARRVMEAFAEGTRRGQGAVALDGQMLDRPVVERARRTLETAGTPWD